jgi:hypothetical protein
MVVNPRDALITKLAEAGIPLDVYLENVMGFRDPANRTELRVFMWYAHKANELVPDFNNHWLYIHYPSVSVPGEPFAWLEVCAIHTRILQCKIYNVLMPDTGN